MYVIVGHRNSGLIKFVDIKEAKKYIRRKQKTIPLRIVFTKAREEVK